MSTGLCDATAMRRASAVALYTARASPPSTRMDSMPYAGPRPAMPSPTRTQLNALGANQSCKQ